jgi:hypothetical protein
MMSEKEFNNRLAVLRAQVREVRGWVEDIYSTRQTRLFNECGWPLDRLTDHITRCCTPDGGPAAPDPYLPCASAEERTRVIEAVAAYLQG